MTSVHDFDFNHGDWEVTNRRLAQRGVGSDEWETFPSTEIAQLLMGGMVSIDESDFPTKGFRGGFDSTIPPRMNGRSTGSIPAMAYCRPGLWPLC